MKKSKHDLWEGLIVLVLGNAFLAFGVAFFVIPNGILSGGVAGVCVALKPLFPFLSTQTMITILTFGLFLVGTLFLGKGFALKTIISSILFPLFTNLFSLFDTSQFIVQEPILASLYSGVFVGIGVGLVFRIEASSGGMDIPPLILNKFFNLPLSLGVLLVDVVTVLLGMITNGVEAALIGLISVWISSYVINKTLLFGAKPSKNVFIISDAYEEILAAIQMDMNRGATILEARGGYTNEAKPTIMVAIPAKEFPRLENKVMHIDNKAFIVVTDADAVKGLGFSYYLEDVYQDEIQRNKMEEMI